MLTSRVIHIVSCHAEGEVGDVIVGGVAPPPGDTIWEQSRFIARDQTLRNFVLNEPRGGVFRHVNLLVPPKNPRAQMGFIIMEPEDTPPMSGSNCICVATVLLDSGILPMTRARDELLLEAPAGLVDVSAACRNGKASDHLTNVPSFADRLDATLEVEGLGTLTVDIAFGGDSFVMAAAALGFAWGRTRRATSRCRHADYRGRERATGFRHPVLTGWDHISFCFMTGGSRRSTAAVQPQRLRHQSGQDRPLADRHGLLGADGGAPRQERPSRRRFIGRSIIESRFHGRIEEKRRLPGRPAIIPSIAGRAWITAGTSTLLRSRRIHGRRVTRSPIPGRSRHEGETDGGKTSCARCRRASRPGVGYTSRRHGGPGRRGQEGRRGQHPRAAP